MAGKIGEEMATANYRRLQSRMQGAGDAAPQADYAQPCAE